MQTDKPLFLSAVTKLVTHLWLCDSRPGQWKANQVIIISNCTINLAPLSVWCSVLAALSFAACCMTLNAHDCRECRSRPCCVQYDNINWNYQIRMNSHEVWSHKLTVSWQSYIPQHCITGVHVNSIHLLISSYWTFFEHCIACYFSFYQGKCF